MKILRHTHTFGLANTFMKRSIFKFLLASCLILITLASQSLAIANNQIEYQVKAAFIYNFIAFTQWPDSTDKTVNLCVYGDSGFGDEINKLHGKPVNNRSIRVGHINDHKELEVCQVVFFSKSVSNNLPNLLKDLQEKPILTLADSLNATSQGVAINMSIANEKIVFEINLGNARRSGLNISSKLLQLAVYVYQ